MALRTVGVRLTAEIGEYQSKLKAAAQTTRDFKGELDKASRGRHLDAVAQQATGAGLALTGMAAYAVKSAADFDRSMSAVKAASYDSSKSVAENAAAVNQLRAAAIQAGKDTQYSATEAAKGITELSKAGVSTADVLGGGLKGALALAAAGQISVAEAAETSASALTQFKLTGAQLPHVADLLAAAAGKAQGSVHDVGLALNQSGLIAAQFGLSIEDTTGALAEFANAGLIGSDAGTSFKTMLLAIANPSLQSRNLMDDLGISFYDAAGKFIGVSGVAQVLQTRLKGLTDAQRQQALGQLFGNDAIRSASILYADGAAGVQKWRGAVDDAGFASDTAAKLTDNLAGDIERLKGSIETLAIQSGGGANSGLRVLTKGLNGVVDSFNAMSPATSGALVVLAGLSGVLLLAGAAWVKYRKTITAAQEQLIATGPAGEKAAVGLGKVTSALGKVGGWAAAAEAAGLLFSNLDEKAADVDRLTAAVTNLVNTGKSSGELNKDFGANFDTLGRIAMFAESANHGFGHFVNGVANSISVFGDAGKSIGNFGSRLIAGTDFDTAKQQMSSLDDALTAYMNSTNDAQKSSDLWNKVLSQSGLNTEQLAELLPNAYKKVGELNTAADQGKKSVGGMGNAAAGTSGKLGDLNSALQVGAEAQDKYKTHAEAAAGAARGERGALVALKNELKSQTDPVFALITAEQGLKEAQSNAAKAAKEHGAKSKEARAAQIDLAKSAIELQGAVGGLGNSFNGKLTPAMHDTLKAAGLTDKQINEVAGQFRQAKKDGDTFARKYAANVKLDGVGPVESKLNELRNQQLALAAGPTASAAQAATENYYKYRTKKAGGGPIYGPGTSTSDSIPAMLSDGEYVIKASSVRQVGLANLDVINNQGRLPQGYAAGGPVWPFDVDVSKTKIPQPALPPGGGAGPGGGQTYHWILGVVHKAFPGLHATSTFRANAVTLSGNRSYHAVGRAVDFPPSKPLAEWVNANYFGQTREFISPWNSLNIKNGHRHAYSGEIYAQHAGLGRWKGNAHDHWAMANGGVINEHIVGVGRSGRTYEFGESGAERITPLRGYAGGGYVNVAPRTSTGPSGPTGSRLDTYDALLAASNAVAQLTAALKENGRSWSTATQKGRDNRSALISGVRAAQAAAKAKFDETGSVRAANKVYDDYIRQLDKSMKAMHVNAATRRALIKAYSERPKYDLPAVTAAPRNSANTVGMVSSQIGVEQALTSARSAFAWTKPSFNVKTATGQAELQELFAYLAAASAYAQSVFDATGNSRTATKAYEGYLSSIKGVLLKSGLSPQRVNDLIGRYGKITLTPKENRWGGLYEHAATGSLRDAQIAAGGPTRYAWAESSTGGELFAPKHGNLQKTRREVGWAVANWWGGNVSWGGHGGAKNVTVQATIPIHIGAETITRQIEFVVDTKLGQVVDATVYQTA